MKLKTIFKPMILAGAAISPIAIIASCGTTNVSFAEVPELDQPTIINGTINYQDLQLSSDINNAQKQISNDLIIANKDKIFKGTTTLLKDVNQISSINLILNKDQQSIQLSFQLNAQSFIEANGLPNVKPRIFKTLITGFQTSAQPPVDTDLEQIQKELEQIAANASFDVTNKNRLASLVLDSEIIWNQQANYGNVIFMINQINPDDQKGILGFKVTFSKSGIFKTIDIETNDSRAISGFEKQISINDEQLVAQEALRLQTNINQVISQNQFSINELNQYKSNPNSFQLNYLQHGFNYVVEKFDFATINIANKNQATQQAIQINLQVKVTKNQSSQKVTLVKQAFVVLEQKPDESIVPWFPDPNLMRQHEKQRLDKLQKNHLLKQSNFTMNEIENFKKNPTKFLANIFGLVPQQYFEYKIEDGDFIFDNSNNQSVIKLKISARLWRDLQTPNVVIKSEWLTFKIKVNNKKDFVLKTTQLQYQINPKSGSDIKVDDTDPNYKYATINVDLQKNQNLNIGAIDPENGEENEKLIRQIIKDRPELIFDITGNLPADYWDNEDNSQFLGLELIKNQTEQNPSGFSVNFIIWQTDSNIEGSVLDATINFTNGYYQAIDQPKPEEQFNQIKAKFEQLISKQALDEVKMHTGSQGVYQFANLRPVNDGLMIGSTWANFLNFSPSEFEKENKFLVNVKVVDDSINYLNNEITFKWKLEGNKNLAQQIWTSSEQKIQYQPSTNWKSNIKSSSSLTFSNNALRVDQFLDQFGFNSNYLSVDQQNENLSKLATNNWTWKAREFALVARFLFYQGFNDGASELAIAIENLPTTNSLSDNPQSYDVVLKAKLNAAGAGFYSPYVQTFGNLNSKPARQFNENDLVEIRLSINSVEKTPFVFTSAAEILPGLGVGNTWGKGRGDQEVIQDQPPRTDVFAIQLGSYSFSIKVNNQFYWSPENINHRFLNLSLMNRYKFNDAFWPIPPAKDGWISDWNDLN